MLNRIYGALGRVLIFAGTTVLLFVAYQLWGTKLDESQHQDELTSEFAAKLGVSPKRQSGDADPSVVAAQVADRLEKVDPQTAPAAVPPAKGEPGGFINIEKIGLLNKAFVEDVTKADLRKGPGHYPGTPLPGNEGNAAIAGHRTTYGAPFNRIDELVPGDKIVTLTPQGRFVYEVLPSPVSRHQGPKDQNWGDGWFAVNPNDVSVIAPTDDNRLTLTACHPKYSAKLRIVVQAKLVDEPAASPVSTTTTTIAGAPPKVVPSAAEQEADLIAGDSNELTPSLLFGALVIVIWLLAMVAAAQLRKRQRRWWPVYVVAVVVSAPALWFCFVHMDRFLPSY